MDQKNWMELDASCKAQKEYCSKNGHPLFAPIHGVCFRCSKIIYQNYSVKGHTYKKASTELITNCPHCNHSFVD